MAFRRPDVLLEDNPSDVKALEGRAGIPRGIGRFPICTGKVCQDGEPTRLIRQLHGAGPTDRRPDPRMANVVRQRSDFRRRSSALLRH